MPRKTNTEKVVDAMRKHGAHRWIGLQEFWCFCDQGADHTTEPRWDDK